MQPLLNNNNKQTNKQAEFQRRSFTIAVAQCVIVQKKLQFTHSCKNDKSLPYT